MILLVLDLVVIIEDEIPIDAFVRFRGFALG